MANKKKEDQSPIDYIMNELHSLKGLTERLDKKIFGGDNPEQGIATIVAGVQSVKNLIWANLILIICGFFFVGSYYEQINNAIKDVIELKASDGKQNREITSFKTEIKILKEDVKNLKQQRRGN